MATTAPGGLDPGSRYLPQALGWKTRENTEDLLGSTSVLCSDGCWFGVATVMGGAERLPGIPRSSPPRLLDRQGWSTLVALAPCSSLFRSPRITAMTTASTSAPSRPLSRSEWVSTLPPWRRLLAMVNWRSVYDIEQESERLRIESLESEKRTKLVENEIAHLKLENKRLAALESRLDALLLNADSSSQTPPATGSN